MLQGRESRGGRGMCTHSNSHMPTHRYTQSTPLKRSWRAQWTPDTSRRAVHLAAISMGPRKTHAEGALGWCHSQMGQRIFFVSSRASTEMCFLWLKWGAWGGAPWFYITNAHRLSPSTPTRIPPRSPIAPKSIT